MHGATVEFDWGEPVWSDKIITRSVGALAVYANENGSVVIRQADFVGEEDEVIVIPKVLVGPVIEAIKRAANYQEG